MNADELCYRSAVELTRLVREKDLSCTGIMDSFYDRIEAINPHINASSNYLMKFHWIPSWFPRDSSKFSVEKYSCNCSRGSSIFFFTLGQQAG